jgi:hypothetical protein
MKKILNIGLLLSCIFLLSSCNKLAYKVLYGVKKPKHKTETQITDFLAKNDYSTDNLYGLNAEAHKRKVGTTTSSVASFTSSALYNRDGFLVKAKDTAINDCWGKVYDFYKNISDSSQLYIDKSNSIYSDTLVMNNLVNLSGHRQAAFSTQDYDYTVVVFWASFLGKLSKQNIALGQLIKLYNPNLKVQIIQINMDYRTFWNKKK